MGKTYIAKESTCQQILSAVRGSSSGGAELANVGKGAMDDVTNASATLISETSCALTWEDPVDYILAGNKIKDWLGTKVVRKEGSVPQDENDGVVVVDVDIRNQYKDSPFIDTGLTCELGTNHHYYYRWFPYNVFNVCTAGMARDVVTSKGTATTIYVTKTALGFYPTHMEESLIFYNYTDGEVTVKTSSPNITATITGNGPGKTLHVSASYIVEGEYSVILMQQGNGVFNGYGELVIPVTLTEDANNIPAEANVASTEIAPELWQEIVNAGVASSLFNVGDKVPIELNGDLVAADGVTVSKSFNHETYYLTILGFDHNKTLESSGKNSIHFILGKNTAGVDIAFYGFPMNTSNINTGGWKSSAIRTKTCTSFFNCLPAKWQLFVKEITKYTDNTGGSDTSQTSYVTATQDKVFLLAEYEVHGVRKYANTGEQSKQAQYDYYKNGNSKIRYNADNTTSAVYWWTRSSAGLGTSERYRFCSVQSTGNGTYNYSATGYGFVPCFSIIAES